MNEIQQLLDRTDFSRVKMSFGATVLKDLLSRGRAIGHGALKETLRRALAGESESSILRYQIDAATTRTGGRSGGYRVDDIDHDDFMRMLTNPSVGPYFD